ncbi:MAG: SDR family NAD(P)-dependent oxidoreductase [archaeon]
MKVLVTGGAGFIGSHLCDALLAKGNEVVCLDNLWRGKKENIQHNLDNEKFTFIEGDIRDKETVKKAVQGCDIIHHLAAINGTKYFYEEPLLITDVNINGTLNVLEACKENQKLKRVTFASSPEVYGEPRQIPTPEDGLCTFDNPIKTLRHSYATSKFLGDIMFLAYKDKFNVPITIIRYFNIYGPRLIGSPYGQVVSIFVQQVLDNKNPTVHGDGTQTRSFTYVDDAVEATILASENEKCLGEAVNIGIQQETSVKELAAKVIKAAGSDLEPEFTDALIGDCTRRCPESGKMKKLTGWEAKITLEEGIQKTLEWFKNKD